MGHALDNMMQDAIIRTKRMQATARCGCFKTDHASIATEVKIVDKLREEGTSRRAGREKFLERAWQWKEQYGGRIVEQLKTSTSCDWARERFTMDEGRNRAVNEFFVLYNKSLIYAHRIINLFLSANGALGRGGGVCGGSVAPVAHPLPAEDGGEGTGSDHAARDHARHTAWP